MSTQFKTASWARNANIYEVNIRQYTSEGTFTAFEKHLPRLQKMGVEILWLMPVTPISVERRKGTLGSYYATCSYTEVNPEFGTAEHFKQLVKKIHELGMHVIIDWVANHTGCDHAWTKLHNEWYQKDDTGNYSILHGWDDVYHLNFEKEEMATEMIGDMQYWIKEFDVDGFRCDMAHLVPLSFWNKARTTCEQLKPLYWLAECEEPDYASVFDTTYSWEWMHASKAKVNGTTTMLALRPLLEKYLSIPEGSLKLLFTSNHDENSWNGTEYERYGDAALMLAVFSCLFKGVPLIYSGQEKPNNKRLLFFDKDELDWNGAVLLSDFYSRLLHIRKHHAAFAHDRYEIIPSSEDDKVLTLLIGNDKENIIAVFNFSTEQVKVNVSDKRLKGKYKYLFTETETELEENYFSILPSFSFNVLCTE